MQTGVIDSDSFSQVLREISQRRRQGILELHYPDKETHISFIAGKIVSVDIAGRNSASELSDKLKFAGWIQDTIEVESFSELFSGLVEAGCSISEGEYQRIVKHMILDKLYSLEMSSGAYFTFKTCMVKAERDFLPSISVGQLLLDLVAIETDTNRFSEIFSAENVVSKEVEEDDILSEEESILFNLIDGKRKIEDLREQSLLSVYHFQDALLAMHERGLVRVSAGQVMLDRQKGGEFDGSLIDQLDKSIDDIFATNTDNSTNEDESCVEVTDKSCGAEGRTSCADIADLRLRLNVVNAKILGSSWLTNSVAIIFLFSALLIPFLLWTHIYEYFSFPH